MSEQSRYASASSRKASSDSSAAPLKWYIGRSSRVDVMRALVLMCYAVSCQIMISKPLFGSAVVPLLSSTRARWRKLLRLWCLKREASVAPISQAGEALVDASRKGSQILREASPAPYYWVAGALGEADRSKRTDDASVVSSSLRFWPAQLSLRVFTMMNSYRFADSPLDFSYHVEAPVLCFLFFPLPKLMALRGHFSVTLTSG